MSIRPPSSGRSFSGSLNRFGRLSFPRLIENYQRNECHTHRNVRCDHCKSKVIHGQTLYLKSAGFVRFLDTQLEITFLEFMVICLQAYVFTVLTASYVQGALADEH